MILPYQKILKYIPLVLALLIYGTASGQNEPLSLSLAKARSIAAGENSEIARKQADLLAAEQNVELAKFKKYPTVFGDFNLQRNLIIPVTPVPAKAFNPNAADGEILPLKFSTKWTGNTGLNASYEVFNPALQSEIRQKEIQAKMAETDRKMTEIEAGFNVSNAYAAAVIADEQLQLNFADVKSKTEILEMLNSQFKAGRITLIELNNGKTDLNEAINRKADAENIAEKAKAQLLFALGYNPTERREIYFEDLVETLFQNDQNFKNPQNQSLSLQKISQQSELLKEQIDSERFNFYPTVTLSAYLGGNYFDNNFDIFKDQNWHGNSYVKAGVRIPITDWFSFKKNQKVLSYQYQANELAYKTQQNQLLLDKVLAKKDAATAKEKYQKLKENFVLVQKNLELRKQQFKEGRIQISEVSSADYAVRKSKNDYLTAAYDYITALIKLENEQIK